MEKTVKKNYRPITVLPIVSKLFEKIMDEQTDAFIDKKLSKYVCGYRKGGYNPQLALTHMIEKMKNSKDNGNHAGAMLAPSQIVLLHHACWPGVKVAGYRRENRSCPLCGTNV